MAWKPRQIWFFGPAVAIAASLLLAGCATSQKPAASAPQAAVVERAPAAQHKGTKPLPIPLRPLSVRADCSFKDPTGYNGQMKLRVAQGLVQEFSASVNHPKHGTCRFALVDFRQVKDMPNVELKSDSSRCTVRMWEQGRQVAVAFSACHAECSGDAVDYVWPILADSYNGTCG